MDWSKLDPNAVIAVVSGFALWVWHLVHKDKTEKKVALRDQIDAAITAEVHAILSGQTRVDMAAVRERLATCAWKLIDKVGIGRNPIITGIVELAIDEGLAELAQIVEQRLQVQLTAAAYTDLAARVAKTPDAFVPPLNPTVPKLDIEVEEIKPTP